MGRAQPWKIIKATYCCYNAFTGQDIWVEARIPGGVSCRIINRDGTPGGISTATASSDLWLGTLVSANLRAIFSVGGAPSVPIVRRLDPLTDESMENKFLEAAAKLLPTIQQQQSQLASPTGNIFNNALVEGLVYYFVGRGRPLATQKFLAQLVPTMGVSLNGVIGRSLVAGDRQEEAIRLWYDSIVARPNCTAVLHEQIDFLLSRGLPGEAVTLAKEALRADPLNWLSWIKLARTQIQTGEFEIALISLNNCPLCAPPETPAWKISAGTVNWLPSKEGIPVDVVENLRYSTDRRENPLDRLRGNSLKGPVKEAYQVLVELILAVGWDDVLRMRSRIFLMEEECVVVAGNEDSKTAPLQPLPVVGGEESMEQIPLDDTNGKVIKSSGNQSKRMCERWLDALFMILFDDLRLFTLFQTEQKRSQTEKITLQRSPRDWLLLGDLARRLSHPHEAIQCYRNCLAEGFCKSAWISLAQLAQSERQGKFLETLEMVVRILEYDDGRHQIILAPSPATEIFFQLIKEYGLERVKANLTTLQHTLPKAEQIVAPLLQYSLHHQVIGHDF